MQQDFSDQQTCPVCESDDMVVDESETRPIAGQWYGRVVSWARFLCRACDAVTLEYDEHEGYQTVWPYPVLSGTGQCDDQILDRNDQIAAEEAIIAALYDLFDRPGHSTCPKTTLYFVQDEVLGILTAVLRLIGASKC